jgi:hypothetical protein
MTMDGQSLKRDNTRTKLANSLIRQLKLKGNCNYSAPRQEATFLAPGEQSTLRKFFYGILPWTADFLTHKIFGQGVFWAGMQVGVKSQKREFPASRMGPE